MCILEKNANVLANYKSSYIVVFILKISLNIVCFLRCLRSARKLIFFYY